MTDHVQPSLVDLGEQAAEAIRALNHRTVFDNVPGYVQYDLLGELHSVVTRLADLTANLSRGLFKSLEEHDVYEDDGGDPADRVAAAREHLGNAGMLATRLSFELERAQEALRLQGSHGRRTDPEPPRSKLTTLPID